MEINSPCVVALTWTLKDTLGEELDVLDEPVEFFVGGDDLLEKIEIGLQGYEPGASVDLHLEPEDAFGDFNDGLIFLEPRRIFPSHLEEGMVFDGHALPQGFSSEAPTNAIYVVTDVYPEHVVLDGNHPLAGMAIRLHLKVHHVRAATPDELKKASCGVGFFNIQTDEANASGSNDLPLTPLGLGKTLH